MKKVELAGGSPQILCDAVGAPRGGSWSRDGVIVFGAGSAQGINRVSSAGGEAVPVTKLSRQETSHRFPSFLPDGTHFLYFESGTLQVFVGSLDSSEGRRLLASDSSALYAWPGYVLFVRQGTLLAQPFDTRSLQLSGQRIPVAEQAAFDQSGGAFWASENGVLAYRTGSTPNLQLTWVDRTGVTVGTVGGLGRYQSPDVSPDGRRIAVHRHDGPGGDVWIIDNAPDGKMSRFTFNASQENASPIWSFDGARIIFGSSRDGKYGIYEKPSNGTGTEALLSESELIQMPMSWSADSKVVAYYVEAPKTGSDVWVLPLAGDRKPLPVLETSFTEQHPQISPDGRWIAYTSNENGSPQIYVQTFPQGGGKWQISTTGGVFAKWRRDGKELFYMTAPNFGKVVSVAVDTSRLTPEFSAPRPLFDSGYLNASFGHCCQWNTYAVSPDGQRFLIPRPETPFNDVVNTPITVVLNWPAGLKK